MSAIPGIVNAIGAKVAIDASIRSMNEEPEKSDTPPLPVEMLQTDECIADEIMAHFAKTLLRIAIGFGIVVGAGIAAYFVFGR